MARLPDYIEKIVLPSGAIRFEVRPEGLDPQTGHRVQFKRRFTTADEAKRFFAEITGSPVEAATRADKSKGGETFQRAAEAWLRGLRRLAASTRDGYRYDLARSYPALGDKRLRDITPEHVEAMVEALLATHGPTTVEATLLRVRAVLRAASRLPRSRRIPTRRFARPSMTTTWTLSTQRVRPTASATCGGSGCSGCGGRRSRACAGPIWTWTRTRRRSR